jgi:hypothetical protein
MLFPRSLMTRVLNRDISSLGRIQKNETTINAKLYRLKEVCADRVK